MNELIGNSKIYALAKEAGLIEFEQFAWNPELGSPTYESVAKARKFAELIIRDCIEAIDAKEYTMGGDTEAKGMRFSINIIKKHFGVEE